jgi:hypothetical protein
MGLLSKFVKAGIAKKVIDEARKPENQAKIKRGVEQARMHAAKRKGRRP